MASLTYMPGSVPFLAPGYRLGLAVVVWPWRMLKPCSARISASVGRPLLSLSHCEILQLCCRVPPDNFSSADVTLAFVALSRSCGEAMVRNSSTLSPYSPGTRACGEPRACGRYRCPHHSG